MATRAARRWIISRKAACSTIVPMPSACRTQCRHFRISRYPRVTWPAYPVPMGTGVFSILRREFHLQEFPSVPLLDRRRQGRCLSRRYRSTGVEHPHTRRNASHAIPSSATHTLPTAIQKVGADHRHRAIAVAWQLLDRRDVVTALKQVDREGGSGRGGVAGRTVSASTLIPSSVWGTRG